ncbi:NhaP-type Na+/H+ or K+/H+ antiporter [Kineosphaera limosa]|uniref:Putative CPA1 family transporter n=1 Tax=Kineosphaera limosa NBRC 100340 TaxID=1184609 RepID=K6WPQ9_9MICO|nr:cation:proton antiporter [Kineosphaera limosa]NYE00045.1 NhaP-type Na+/H+ or K+/H+ antiporter [Kineosphaera limosa]GAB95781.1 putative CPA1 family transporter [Kineosphaera limosa NBRC 100340]
MTTAILACGAVLLIWALAAEQLRTWRITAPMVMVAGGLAVGAASALGIVSQDFDLKIANQVLTGRTAQQIAEVILALVLFVDSFEIRRGILGHEPKPASRLLFLALPLSILLGTAAGLWAFPALSVAAVLAIVCAVVPTDMAPAADILKDKRFPERVRNVLNVESGYNDGIVAPIFIFALTLAGNTSHAATPQAALAEALPASLKAIVVGVASGLLMRFVVARGWSSSTALRVGVVTIPLLAYALAFTWHGNGFVAAFVAGLAFRAARGHLAHSEIDLTEDLAALTGYVMWFVLGVCSVIAMQVLFSWQVALFPLAALTVVRIVPVLLCLLGSSMPLRDRMLVALLGPRGIATIVFGLLAFADLPANESETALAAMVVTVLASFVLHGVGAPFIARVYERRAAQVTGPAPAPK